MWHRFLNRYCQELSYGIRNNHPQARKPPKKCVFASTASRVFKPGATSLPPNKTSRGGNEKVLLVDHQDTYFCPKSNINLGMVQWAYHGKSVEAITFSPQFEPTSHWEASTFLAVIRIEQLSCSSLLPWIWYPITCTANVCWNIESPVWNQIILAFRLLVEQQVTSHWSSLFPHVQLFFAAIHLHMLNHTFSLDILAEPKRHMHTFPTFLIVFFLVPLKHNISTFFPPEFQAGKQNLCDADACKTPWKKPSRSSGTFQVSTKSSRPSKRAFFSARRMALSNLGGEWSISP